MLGADTWHSTQIRSRKVYKTIKTSIPQMFTVLPSYLRKLQRNLDVGLKVFVYSQHACAHKHSHSAFTTHIQPSPLTFSLNHSHSALTTHIRPVSQTQNNLLEDRHRKPAPVTVRKCRWHARGQSDEEWRRHPPRAACYHHCPRKATTKRLPPEMHTQNRHILHKQVRREPAAPGMGTMAVLSLEAQTCYVLLPLNRCCLAVNRALRTQLSQCFCTI
jgi:hypothetical protein